jgi:2-polyprenyl-3-methyl-5-hydroxy-6-metoxy-1,4-benzoquinol methylase
MCKQSELAEKSWWNQYADLEGRIWNYNRFLSWVIRRGYLKEMIKFLYRPGGRVLDIGCGDGWVSLLLAQKGMHLDGLDLSEAQIELARRRAQVMELDNVTFRCARAANLPKGARYESVIIHATLHHLDQEQRQTLLHQISTMLTPGGRLYMYEPIAALTPQPLIARLLDKGMGSLIRSLKQLTRMLRWTDEDIRLAVKDGWTMRSPTEAPLTLSQIESELPQTLKLKQVRYWHVFSVAYANFCMELRPLWQAIFSPATILFYGLDRVIFRLGIGQHLLSWPMATIMIEKAK